MTALKGMTLGTMPDRGNRDPLVNRRLTMIKKLEHQRAKALDDDYVRVEKRFTGKGEERRVVERQKAVRPWFRTDARGRYFLSLFVGARPIGLDEKGSNAVVVNALRRNRCEKSMAYWSAPGTVVLIHRAPRAATVVIDESLGRRGVSQFPGDLDRQGVRIDGHVPLVDEEVGVALEPLAFEIREPDPMIFLLLAVLDVGVPHHFPPAVLR
jgi:hypothetical protein